MNALQRNRLYLEQIEGLSEDNMNKMIDDGLLTPALLIDIGKTLAALTDAVTTIAEAIKGGQDEGTGNQGQG